MCIPNFGGFPKSGLFSPLGTTVSCLSNKDLIDVLMVCPRHNPVIQSGRNHKTINMDTKSSTERNQEDKETHEGH